MILYMQVVIKDSKFYCIQVVLLRKLLRNKSCVDVMSGFKSNLVELLKHRRFLPLSGNFLISDPRSTFSRSRCRSAAGRIGGKQHIKKTRTTGTPRRTHLQTHEICTYVRVYGESTKKKNEGKIGFEMIAHVINSANVTTLCLRFTTTNCTCMYAEREHKSTTNDARV